MRTSNKQHPPSWMLMTLGLALSLVMTVMPLGRIMTSVQASNGSGAAKGQQEKGVATERSTTNAGIQQIRALSSADAVTHAPTLDSGDPNVISVEAEPNDTPATAQPLIATPVRVRADLFKAPFSAGVDVDVYSFAANAGDRVYAATMTGFSGGSTDTVMDILASDGTTVLESDDEDGTIGGSASNIGGLLLASAGTYYVRVRQFSTTSLSGTIRPYDLYVRVQTGVPTPETEPNNNGTPQALPANGYVIGAIATAGDNDTYAFSANAGDTIIAILDGDPERDSPEWNPRLAIGVFNNFFLLANGSGVGGTFDDANPSEALMMTVNATGTYQVYVDEAAAGGAPTDTYTLSVSVIPPNLPKKCTSYAGTTGAIADLATTNFTVNIPDSKIISKLQLAMSETHGAAATADLDVSLISPDGNEVVLFDDPPTNATAPAPQINTVIDDEAAIPISNFGVHSGMQYTPELYARMAYFKGQQAQGTWTLRIRDDTTANTGTLNSWSLNVCEDPSLSGPAALTTSVIASDFEADDGGFTHSGTADTWARGLPSGASAPITSCHSGTNCWKTNLTGTYSASSNQDLLSPNIDLTSKLGQAITARWWQKYQIETASFDPAWVEVREVGNPANFRKLWEWKGATQTRSVGNPAVTVQMSAGWGQMEYDISDFSGKIVQLRYHLESDSSGQFSGLAVDDVSVTALKLPVRANFDGATGADLSVFRPNDTPGNAKWYIFNSGDNSVTQQQFGASSDKPVPGDYDGDGDVDIAVFRPTEGAWYVSHGSAQMFDRVEWGLNGDIPVPGDYDGDGKTDFAVFRPSDGNWYVLQSTGGFTARQWGIATDKPVQADYDGDGKTDLAVYRDGNWYILQSFTGTVRTEVLGLSSDLPVSGDYDGDRQYDVAVWRPSTGNWYILQSTTKLLRAVQWGATGDKPVPTDFDGDRKFDLAVWRPSTGNWYILQSTTGTFTAPQWGQSGDVPGPAAGYLPE